MEKNPRISKALESAVNDGVFPGAVLLVGHKGKAELVEAVGWASVQPSRRPMTRDTIFDVSSLTKPLATILSLMSLADQGNLDLKIPLGDICSAFMESPSNNTPVECLINHCSGLPDWKPFYKEVPMDSDQGKSIVREALLSQDIEYRPGTKEIYSDLGYLMLCFLVEVTTGTNIGQFAKENIFKPLGLSHTGFNPTQWEGAKEDDFAATEYCPWRKRVIIGEVHDENAWAAGGACGHAGLFSNVFEIFKLIKALPQANNQSKDDSKIKLHSEKTTDNFLDIANLVNKSEWWMGLNHPTPENSSSGRYFSPKSIGHLGYSGCSFWFDPERELTVILLSNRIHPSRKNEKIKQFRPQIHDIVFEEFID
jgi:CubicO group peptidase (beta-lactamase class C family)